MHANNVQKSDLKNMKQVKSQYRGRNPKSVYNVIFIYKKQILFFVFFFLLYFNQIHIALWVDQNNNNNIQDYIVQS